MLSEKDLEKLEGIVLESIQKVLSEERSRNERAFVIKDYYPGTDEWLNYIRPNRKEIWNFLNAGYIRAGIGNFVGCDNGKSLYKNANHIRIAFSDDDWVAISVYTGYRGGYKCVGITATTDEGKRKIGVAAVHDIIKKDIGLYNEFYWTECSGKIAELYEKYKGIKIPFEYAQQMVKPVIQQVDEYRFTRPTGLDEEDDASIKIVYGFNSKETFDAVYKAYNEYIDAAIKEIENRKIDETIEQPSFGRYSTIEYSENIINVFVDIRWTYRIYELPEDKFPIIKQSVNILSKYISSGKCPQDKIRRIQQAIDNGNEILATSSPMKLNIFK